MSMIKATNEDKLKWAYRIMTTNSAQELIAVMENIWEDGYRCAEAEVTYSATPEEPRR